jgi:hypothetical protein
MLKLFTQPVITIRSLKTFMVLTITTSEVTDMCGCDLSTVYANNLFPLPTTLIKTSILIIIKPKETKDPRHVKHNMLNQYTNLLLCKHLRPHSLIKPNTLITYHIISSHLIITKTQTMKHVSNRSYNNQQQHQNKTSNQLH